jgi:uncharacterized membrane protein
MIKKLSDFEKMIFLSISFTIALVVGRFLYTNDAQYFFYPWNLFLATVPYFFSRQLRKYRKINMKVVLLLLCWLLFLPNAPYIITDLFHFEQRPGVPYWFDLLLVVSGAWNGVVLGIISLTQVEKFLTGHIKAKWMMPAIIVLITLCSYGIYLGRFKRYNSWNVITRPEDLIHTVLSQIAEPWEHMQAWLFTISFAILLCIIYFTVKKMPLHLEQSSD